MNGPQDWFTTAGLIAATISSIVACIAAAVRLLRMPQRGRTLEIAAVITATVICGAVFMYRAFAVHQSWVPLQSHVDGLALLAGLVGMVVMWSYWTRRLQGLNVFLLPVMALVSLWGVCAGWWSWKPFDISSVWTSVHLFSVYIGTLSVAAAAAKGALWLYVDRQLRARTHQAQRLHRLGALANLESIEVGITRSATIGFVLLTIGLITGLIITTGGESRLGPGWWYSAKVVLAAGVWAIYALVMHVRFVPTFRGRRAAILSIVGLVLLIVVLGISQALPGPKTVQSSLFKVQSEPRLCATHHFELATVNCELPPKEASECI